MPILSPIELINTTGEKTLSSTETVRQILSAFPSARYLYVDSLGVSVSDKPLQKVNLGEMDIFVPYDNLDTNVASVNSSEFILPTTRAFEFELSELLTDTNDLPYFDSGEEV